MAFNSMRKIHSFDVFDTVITRTVSEPWVLFHLLGRRVSDKTSASAGDFCTIRRSSESVLREEVWPCEVTLDQIYARVGQELDLSEDVVSGLKDAELSLEEELIRPVPGMVGQLQALRDHGARIVFVSDTYLPGAFLDHVLSVNGISHGEDRVYASSEYGRGKEHGLFDDVVANEGVSARDVVHHGNDVRSDVKGAVRSAIAPMPTLRGNLNRYERLLSAAGEGGRELPWHAAAASRLARLEGGNDPLTQVAASVVAPTLCGWVCWILRRARDRGLERLYFLARDGQILHRLAQVLAPAMGLAIDLRYLYSSRHATFLPSVYAFDDSLAPLFVDKTLEDTASAAGMSRPDLEPAVKRLGFGDGDWGRELSPDEQTRLQGVFVEPAIQAAVERSAAQRRAVFLGYLEQEGVFDGVPHGLVEIGWHGRIQAAVNRVIETEGHESAPWFYFGLNNDPPRPGMEQEAFFFDRRTGKELHYHLPRVIPMMESFCRADHGLTLEYREQDGRIGPVFQDDGYDQVVEWGLPRVQRTVQRYAEVLAESAPGLLGQELRPSLLAVLRAFWFDPSPDEARSWGAFPFQPGIAGVDARQSLATPIGLRQVAANLAQGRLPKSRWSSWFAGSVAVSHPILRPALAAGFRVWLRQMDKRNAAFKDAPS